MKYAREVINLMGAHPGRKFKMRAIVNSVMADLHLSASSRVAVRKGVSRVLDAMIESGVVHMWPSPAGSGGYALYSFGQKRDTQSFQSDPDFETIRRPQVRPQKESSPVRAYAAQKNHAAARGIDWEFTFETWWEIWEPYFHLRGPGRLDLCMARFGDVGPYAPSNVYLTTNSGNSIDRNRSQKAIARKQATKERRESRFFYQNKRNTELGLARRADMVADARDEGLI